MKLRIKLACLICIFATPVILSSCRESINVEEIASTNFTKSVKPSNEEVKDFKNWYYNLESDPNTRAGAEDDMYELQEFELWKKAKSHKQEKSSNKLMTLPLIDFKEKGKTKMKQLYLTEIDGKKEGYKIEIKSNNGKSDKFTGIVIISSLDEKSKREYKYKENKLESKKNLRMADFGNVDLPEVTVSASAYHNNNWYFVTLTFSFSNSSQMLMCDAPVDETGSGGINYEYDSEFIEATIDEIRDKLLSEASKHLNSAEMDILRTLRTSDIIKFYSNYLTATKLTDRMWPGTLGSADPTSHPNAFKHTLFAALHTQDFGVGIATLLTNAHEVGQGNGCDTQMDLLNNAIGISLGHSHNGTLNDLIMKIYNMAKNGQLWTVGGNCIHKVPF
ncbi:MAG: hypothetical protein MUF58_13855 [Arcicella sp.]|jgi:hypothetical protein|nr:hypothetical protein [Arcicella sp.]